MALADVVTTQGLLLVFMCNHCPYAKASWPLLIELHKNYGKQVMFVAVNSNDAATYPEDSFKEMQEKKKEWEIPFRYLYDTTQEVARAYQAQCTPDPYLFNIDEGTAKLYYHGRINDNWQHSEEACEHDLKEALEKLLSGEVPPKIQHPSMGCSIKWKTS